MKAETGTDLRYVLPGRRLPYQTQRVTAVDGQQSVGRLLLGTADTCA